jgi:hypothetical protein
VSDRPGSCDPESEKDDVAGHVRDENVTEFEVAGRVDQPGDNGEDQEQRRKRAVLAAARRPNRLGYLFPDARGQASS